MHWLSVLLGLVIARVLLFFIGPRPHVSYYVQAPVVGMPISEIDSAFEAVGLSRQARSPAPEPFPARAPVPQPEPSVADLAVQAPAPMVVTPAPAPMVPAPAPIVMAPAPVTMAPAPAPSV